jgi:hypothetical protein
MIALPFGLNVDLSSLLAGVTFTVIAGWIASFFALRKDERAVQLEQITKERTKWRDNMRKTTEEIAQLYFDNKVTAAPGKVALLRARLVTSINAKDDPNDQLILTHYDEIFAGAKTDLDVLTKRIALLLKHDWERVKWECSPIYVKVFTRFTKRQRAWRGPHYRAI